MTKLTIVHGNDDAHEQECESLVDAMKVATKMERERHGEKFNLQDFKFKMQTLKITQFGTGYHYVVIEEAE